MIIEEITVKKLNELLKTDEKFLLLDIREQWERDLVTIKGSKFISMGTLPLRVPELDKAKKIVVYCHTGVRSAAVTAYLMREGFKDVMNMTGGIDAWVLEIDPSLPRY